MTDFSLHQDEACKLIAEGFYRLGVKGLGRVLGMQVARRIVQLAAPAPPSKVRELPTVCNRFVRLVDASRELGICRETAYRWLRAGRLRCPIDKRTKQPIHKVNGLRVVSRESVDQCLAEIS